MDEDIQYTNTMSEEHALWLQTTPRGMSRTGYQELRASLLNHQLLELPGWNKTKAYRDKVNNISLISCKILLFF